MIDYSKWDASGKEVWSAMNAMNQYVSENQAQEKRNRELADWDANQAVRDYTRAIQEATLGAQAVDAASASASMQIAAQNRKDFNTKAGVIGLYNANTEPGSMWVQAGDDGMQLINTNTREAMSPVQPLQTGQAGIDQYLRTYAQPLTQYQNTMFDRSEKAANRSLQEEQMKATHEDNALNREMQLRIAKMHAAAMGRATAGGGRGSRGGASGAGALGIPIGLADVKDPTYDAITSNARKATLMQMGYPNEEAYAQAVSVNPEVATAFQNNFNQNLYGFAKDYRLGAGALPALTNMFMRPNYTTQATNNAAAGLGAIEAGLPSLAGVSTDPYAPRGMNPLTGNAYETAPIQTTPQSEPFFNGVAVDAAKQAWDQFKETPLYQHSNAVWPSFLQ